MASSAIYMRKYRLLHPGVGRDYTAAWVRDHPEKKKAYAKRFRDKARQEAIYHYGGLCACCGEATFGFLTIDHVNGGGAEHRRKIGRDSTKLYVWLKKQGWPEGFRVLCYNCNCAKGHYGKCPHEEGR